MQIPARRRTTDAEQANAPWPASSLTMVAVTSAAVIASTTAPPAFASRKEPPPPPPPPAATYSITDLGNLGFQNTVARAINNNGQITGYSGTPKTVEGGCSLRFRPCPTHVTNAFLWEAGTMSNLGTLGGNYSEGTGLNNLGEVVGKAQLKSGVSEAFLFRNRKMTGIGSFSPA
jgi:probable HAF family extracellular repeat protein